MEYIIDRYDRALDRELYLLQRSSKDTATQYRKAILLCRKALLKLRTLVLRDGFPDQASEVIFFKQYKPRLYSRYVYYVQLFNYHIKTPAGGPETEREYICKELNMISYHFEQNRAFYQYYRSGATQLDIPYFTRGHSDPQAELEDFEADLAFSTSYDYKLSKIIANERFRDHLRIELSKLDREDLPDPDGKKLFPFKHPAWTASQTDAVELLYALKTACAVNNGNIEISELVSIFEFVFQTELNETYHKLLDITKRKKEMFVFLTRIRNSFWNFIRDKFE